MRILHTVHSYLPARHGMAELVRQVSERLVRAGHNVTVATSKDDLRRENVIEGVSIEEFDIKGNITLGITGEFDRYVNFLLSTNFDIITNFHAQTWATDLCIQLLLKLTAKKIMVPTGFSQIMHTRYASYYEDMKSWLNRYDKVVYHSECTQDAEFAHINGLNNGVIIPNGAAMDEFDFPAQQDIRFKLGIEADDILILHASGYTNGKGHAAALKIFLKANIPKSFLLFVSPEFETKLEDKYKKKAFKELLMHLVYGKRLSDLTTLQLFNIRQNFLQCTKRRVLFSSFNREDFVDTMKVADLFLFPSEIECAPIVLYEAIASGTPFLTTDVGNAVEIAAQTGGGLILPTLKKGKDVMRSYALIRASADQLRSLVLDKKKRKRMAEDGKKIWRKLFTWEQIARKYEQLYENLMAGGD